MVGDTFQEMLAAVGITITPPSPDFSSWLARRKAPQKIIELFAPGLPLPMTHRLRGRWEFLAEGEIQETAGEFPRYLKAGLLAIGSCPNGDPIALDVRKKIGAVGYISHDEVWEDEEARIRNFFVVVAPSLTDFARGVRDGTLPIDYWDAIERK